MNFVVNYYQGNFKLLLIQSNSDEQEFLESHIGEIVELHASQNHELEVDKTCDCGELFPEGGYCKFCGAHQRQATGETL